MGIVDKDIGDVISKWNCAHVPTRALSTSTGVPSLDLALGGGLPSGVTEIYGESSTGKTSLLFEILSTAQRHGWASALCPSEYLDIPYMRRLGVDLDSLLIITGNTGESSLDGGLRFIKDWEGQDVLLAIDSATCLRPRLDEFGSWNLMIDDFLEEAGSLLGARSAVVMTSQVRTRRSVRPGMSFVRGDVDSTSRRVVDRFSARMELGRSDVSERRFTMWVNIMASQFSRPGTIVSLEFIKGEGIDTMRDLLRLATAGGVVENRGSWYVFEEETLGHGEDAVTALLEAEPDLAKRILDRVM